MFSWLLATALALSSPPPAQAATIAPDPIPRSEVMAMPPELRARVHEIVIGNDASPRQRFQRLMNFVVDSDGLGMTYEEEATYTVAEAYATRKANCLTFTLLVMALAKEAGLEAYPQEVGETLSWRQVEGTIYRDNHINAGVRVNGHRFTIDPAADLIFLPRPPVKVSQERLLSHYYNNVAVDRLQQGRLDAALQNMAVAIELDPSYATLWSNVGVMHLHNGNTAAAERAYLKALALDPSDSSALFNMVQLLHQLNDPRERGYRQRLARVEQNDPLQQFLQALDQERTGNYTRAIDSMRRAIQLKPDEHRFYAALARIYERAGDISRARSALAGAQSHSRGKVQAHYQAERERLRKLQATRD
jgi:Tfp pilus assembly protein PilF